MRAEPVAFDDGLRAEARRRLIERAAAADRRWRRAARMLPFVLVLLVLGGLVAIAVPNFLTFNCRAVQSEPKSSLPIYRQRVQQGQVDPASMRSSRLRYRYGAVEEEDGVLLVAVGNPYGRGADVWVLPPGADQPRNVVNVCTR